MIILLKKGRRSYPNFVPFLTENAMLSKLFDSALFSPVLPYDIRPLQVSFELIDLCVLVDHDRFNAPHIRHIDHILHGKLG